MVRHNNVVPYQHFHKKWARRVKTWLDQPAQKKIRRDRRKQKAAAIAPRPSSGALRPLVHCPTQKYNSKVKLGRGFTLEELKEAKLNPSFAQSVGIAVDHRRTNKSEESFKLNVARLTEYKSRLVVFPRRSNKPKKGDASKEETASVRQIKGDIIAPYKADNDFPLVEITEDMKEFNAYRTLRSARNDQKLVGIREKKAKEDKPDKPEE